MKTLKHWTIAIFLLLGSLQSAAAATLDQYASSVLGFSSQWSTSSWAAAQILGAPNTFSYGDKSTAWAPLSKNGTLEFISVGFSTPVFAEGATIRETWGNGFVYQIDVIDVFDTLHTVWSGTDPSLPGTPIDFLATWTETSFLVDGLKIYTDTNHNRGAWEEIDSIQLHGVAASTVPVPAAVWLFSTALLGFVGMARKTIVT